MAVSNGSVNLTQEFPYISTCGTQTPQSCVFAQILSIGALMVVWIVLIRFQQLRDCGYACRANTASLVLGLVCALGCSIVGNFQQSAVMQVHLLGAFLAFFVGVAYFWIQVYLTYSTACCPGGGRWLGPVRIMLCCLCTVLIITMSVLHNQDYRSAAAGCEWGAATAFFLLFALFAEDFRYVDCHQYHVQNGQRAKGTPQEMTSTATTAPTA
ncbi:modulator of macroautophagy TMEM150B isoform X2 [Amia ocellicauda]